MEIFYVLLILLVITRAFGELAVRFQQPALVGELLSGIILGAFAAGVFFTKRTMDDQVFKGVQDRVSGITTGFLHRFFLQPLDFILISPRLLTYPFFC